MNSRERVITAIGRMTPDRVPADYKADPEVDLMMMDRLAVGSHDELLEKLEVDVRRLNPRYVGPPPKRVGDGVVEDYWGIRTTQLSSSCGSHSMNVHNPLWDAQSVEDLEAHAWPTPDIFDYSAMREQRDRYQKYAILYEGADLFTRPCILRNMENLLMDMMVRPEMAHYLLERFTGFYCEDIARALDATDGGFDIYCEWSDFGTQNALIMSAPMWREFIAPYLKRLIDVVHSGGARFMLHSCGAISELIPDFIGLGVDVLDPIQVAAVGMDPAVLKRRFGRAISFHGGVCTQTTLPFGTPQEVRDAVLDRVATLGAGGGYIIASSHDIGPDTPAENILAMYDPALRECR